MDARRLALAAVIVLAVPMLSGCLGDGRTEWAYDVTQIAQANERGRSGAGVVIGVLDTGINVGHPSLDHLVDGNDGNGELLGFRDEIRGRHGVAEAYDDEGHGSHVIGIMAARGSSFGDKLVYGGIDLGGASPGASYYVAKVCDNEGCPSAAIQRGLDWMLDERVDVVSLSLGGLRNPLALTDAIRTAINDLIDAGIVVVASAGNNGPGSDAPTNDVNAPADIQGVIAVGAVDAELNVLGISSRGDNDGANACREVLLTGQLGRCAPHEKPEIVAPGHQILSAWKEDAYVRATGTSQAAPFVASIVALMLEDHAKLRDRDDVYLIKRILMQSAVKLDDQSRPHDDGAGYGLVQAVKAIQQYGGF